MMKEAFNSDPDVWLWIKGDGVDVVKGVGESVRGICSGDVDLNDGAFRRYYVFPGRFVLTAVHPQYSAMEC